MTDNTETQLKEYLMGIKDEDASDIAILVELETEYRMANLRVLSKLIPYLVYTKNYTLDVSVSNTADCVTYHFNKETTKEIKIDYQEFYIEVTLKDTDEVFRIELVDTYEILLIDNSTDIKYTLEYFTNTLADEYLMPKKELVTDNVVEVNFKDKKLF